MMEYSKKSYIYQFVGNCLMPSLKFVNKNGDERYKNFNDIKPLEWQTYSRDCATTMFEIEKFLNDLENIIVLMSQIRITNKMKSKKILRYDLIIYHLENFYIRITGILDRCLVLVLKILEIKTNKKIQKTLILNLNITQPIGKEIENLNLDLFDHIVNLIELNNKYSDIRNNIAHIEQFYDPRLQYPHLFLILVKDSVDDEIAKFEHFNNSELNKHISTLKIELTNIIEFFRKILNEIYFQCEIEFRNRIKTKHEFDENIFDKSVLDLYNVKLEHENQTYKN